ncbi:MAG: hypothetical protein ABI467_06020 [Kofleriaceae bacterium]
MSKLRQRSLFGGLFIVLGALMFLVASAFIVDRGYPKVLAGIVGALAFPVLPVAWQIWGERARRRKQAEAKKPSKSTLSGYDRFWIRFVAVAVVILGPMFYMQRLGVLGAVKRHATWFVPAFQPGLGMLGTGPHRDLGRIEPLLKRVPGDAEAVIVWAPRDVRGEGLIAFDNHDVVAAGEGDMLRDDDMIRHINEFFKAQHVVLLDPLAMVLDRDITIAASDTWKAKVEPAPAALPTVLRDNLARVPGDAELFGAIAPRTIREAKAIKSGAFWAVRGAKGFVFESRLEAADVGKAYQLIHDLRALRPEQLPLPAACRDKAAKVLARLELAQVGTVVTSRVMIDEADLSCAD